MITNFNKYLEDLKRIESKKKALRLKEITLYTQESDITKQLYDEVREYIKSRFDELLIKKDENTYNFNDNIDTLKSISAQPKGYLDQLKGKAAQTIVNAAANYTDNLETKLREIRGSAVNNLLQQFRNLTTINKIEPDNVYNPDFNNRVSLKNLGKEVSSGLLNDLENTVKGAANF